VKIRLSKPFTTFLKIALSLGALAFVFSKINFGDVITIYSRSNIWLLMVAVILFAVSKAVAAFRLNVFFRQTGVHISETYNLRLYLLGMFYNLFLPGGIGGDGYKIYHLHKTSGIRARKIFWAVLFDRVNGVLALFCLAVLLSLFIHPHFVFTYKPFIWLLIPVSILVLYLVLRKFFNDFSEVFAGTTLQSFMVQLTQTLTAFVIFTAIGGTGQVMEYLFIFLLSSIVAMLPFTIGGVGSREITFLFGAQLMHLDVNTSIAMSLMFYIITAFVSFWGIYYSIRPDVFKQVPENDGVLD